MVIDMDAISTAEGPSAIWGRSFRPFFLGLSLFASISVPWWVFAWLGWVRAPGWPTASAWHGHEMIFGFVAAAIAGFLLTASAVWSGRPAVSGRPLIALLLLWVAGRVAFVGAGCLPPALVAAVDLAFLPAVALGVAWTLWGSGQWRNYAVVGIVAVLATANAVVHANVLGLSSGPPGGALRFAVHAVVLLLIVITGRITPAFTQAAFQRRGIDRLVRSRTWIDAILLGSTAGLAISHVTLGPSRWVGILALVAGSAAALRVAGWQSWHTRSDPLLWSLHVGSAWIAFGLLLTGASHLGLPIPDSSGLHALTTGAMGGTILAVITRVGLGHTGRPLEAGAPIVAAYALVNAAAVTRVVAPLAPVEGYRALLLLGALAWASAFAIFAICYWRILTQPRPDGRPG